jgi:hypothetical protein
MDQTHTQTTKKAVSQYNKCNQVPPVLSSKDHLIKEPKDFTCCEEVGLRILKKGNQLRKLQNNIIFL